MICLACEKNERRAGEYFCPSCSFASAQAAYAVTGWRNPDKYGVDNNGQLYPYDVEPLPAL